MNTDTHGKKIIFRLREEKNKGRILNIKYSARIMGWHDKGEREKEKGKRIGRIGDAH